MRAARGITLVEVLVVLVVLGILVALAAPSLADILDRRRVQALAEQISADIAFARSETALRNQNSVTLYFQQDSSTSCYTMAYYGGLGNCQCAARPGLEQACSANTREFKTSRTPRSTGVSFAPTSGNSVFTKFSFTTPQMTASPANFAIAVNGRSARLEVQVNAMGRTRICSPDGSMSGAPSCN